MKRLSILACVVSVALAGCNGKISPVTPTNVTTLVAQLSAAGVIPPPVGGETQGVGSVTFKLTPTTGGYNVTFTLAVGNLPPATTFVAGLIQQGGAGTVGPPVYQTPITYPSASAPTAPAAPVLTPTGAVRLDFTSNPVLAQAVGDAISASPSSFYFQLYSAVNQTGSLRGQLVKQ